MFCLRMCRKKVDSNEEREMVGMTDCRRSKSIEETNQIITVKDVQFPKSNLFQLKNIKRALHFKPHSDDVIICSYPKCDSKLVDIITWSLLYPFLKLPSHNPLMNRYITPIETHGSKSSIFPDKSPRVLKTYLPHQLFRFHKRAKYIYVLRAPWNSCVSYYAFLKRIGCDTVPESFDEFFELFLEGDLGYGSYVDHITHWIRKRDHTNVLVLIHENVQKNPQTAMFSIASFLGESHLKQLLISDRVQNAIRRLIKDDELAAKDFNEKNSLETLPSRLVCSEEQMVKLISKISVEMKEICVEKVWLDIMDEQAISSAKSSKEFLLKLHEDIYANTDEQ